MTRRRDLPYYVETYHSPQTVDRYIAARTSKIDCHRPDELVFNHSGSLRTARKAFCAAESEEVGDHDSRCCNIFEHIGSSDPHANLLKITHYNKECQVHEGPSVTYGTVMMKYAAAR